MFKVMLIGMAMAAAASAAVAGPLHDAAKDGDLTRLQELIAAGEDLTAQDNIAGTALHWVAITGNVDAARPSLPTSLRHQQPLEFL